jgi:hypothetical protein
VELQSELVGLLLMVLGIGIGFNLRELRLERLKERATLRKRAPRR